MRIGISELSVLSKLALAAASLAACSQAADAAGQAGNGGTGAVSGNTGRSFNQCGVAAPLPKDTGQCTPVSAPVLADFDDYAGSAASTYGYYVNAKPPAANALLGAILHIGDGSDANGGTSVISTEMVTGAGTSGYALKISNSNALHWGGLLMFYFPSSGANAACLNANAYQGIAFSIQGTSPTGKFGVNFGILDTMPKADRGLCDSASSSDCKDATVQLALPADPTAWTEIKLPWSAFTPGLGADLTCVPLTGQNIARLVIQPLMKYPPPNYMFEAGPYTIAVDNVRFF
ncbi:MAG: hypothetical protein ACOY0T_09090 [Myxococcota bacterium]